MAQIGQWSASESQKLYELYGGQMPHGVSSLKKPFVKKMGGKVTKVMEGIDWKDSESIEKAKFTLETKASKVQHAAYKRGKDPFLEQAAVVPDSFKPDESTQDVKQNGWSSGSVAGVAGVALAVGLSVKWAGGYIYGYFSPPVDPDLAYRQYEEGIRNHGRG